MASTKELFAPGLNYILREIADGEELLKSGTEYLQLIQGKLQLGTNNKAKLERQICKIKNDLSKIKEQIKSSKADYKYYAKEYSYEWDEDIKDVTKAEKEKYNIHPATDEEIKADYERDLKECGYDKRYTEKDHNALIDRVNEFNRANDLPLLKY